MWLDLARLGEQGLPKKRRLGSGRREKRVRRSVSFFFHPPTVFGLIVSPHDAKK